MKLNKSIHLFLMVKDTYRKIDINIKKVNAACSLKSVTSNGTDDTKQYFTSLVLTNDLKLYAKKKKAWLST